MNERHLVAAAAGLMLLVAVVTVTWVVLSPGWAVRALAAIAQEELGRGFTASDADLDFSPLEIRIEQPVLAGQSEAAGSLLTAESMVIPISFSEILARRPALTAFTLNAAEFGLMVDERGQASWDFPAAQAGRDMSITLKQASFRYFDARNGQALRVANVDGLMKISATGGVEFEGSAVINALVARVALSLKSLPRINTDGSPLEIVVESEPHAASFSGRLSTAKVLNLAGPVTITSANPAGIARMAGIALPDGAAMPGPLNLNGALDSAGRAYAVRNAAVTFGQFRAMGDVVADLRGERPKLQLNLEADTLWLDALLPASGAEPGSWGRTVLPVERLRGIDAEASILSRAMSFRGYETGATRFTATLTDGRLAASGASRLANGGTLSFTAKADAVVLPPAGALTLTAENAEIQPLLSGLTGIAALAGTGTLSLDLSAQGRTQEELAGTLKGTASLTLASGRFEAGDMGRMFKDLRQRILDGWGAIGGETPIETLAASASFDDGVATLTEGRAKLAGVEVNVGGTADVLRHAVDLKAEFASPEAAPLPVPVIVRGNWAMPKLFPDIPDILNNPDGFARLRGDAVPPAN